MSRSGAARPNVVLTLADDMGFADLGVMGWDVVLSILLEAWQTDNAEG